MTGADTIARIQGPVESILFARANSMAPADQGEVKSFAATAVVFGCVFVLLEEAWRREGEMRGEENERR
jgi:hypothetical protein